MRNAENKKRRGASGIRKLECGLRPIGAYAYAPAGMRKIRKGRGHGTEGVEQRVWGIGEKHEL